MKIKVKNNFWNEFWVSRLQNSSKFNFYSAFSAEIARNVTKSAVFARSAQISFWARLANSWRNSPILKYDERESLLFRNILKNQDSGDLGYWICARSRKCPRNSAVRKWLLQHIWCPKWPKSRFSRVFRKFRNSAPSYSRMGKFRQKLANLAHFEIWALIRDFRDFRKINNSHPGYAEISPSQIKCLEIKKKFNVARKHPLGHQNPKY